MEKVTIYYGGIMGISSVEAKLVEHGTRKWAQYAAAPYATFIPKRARKARTIQQSRNPNLLIVKGWNQPKPDGIYDEATTEVRNGFVCQRGRYASCDPRWQSDFDAMMAAQDVEIIADYRGHQS